MRPKPMVEIGGKPILWHIMKIYAAHGIEEFVICLGYKGYLIKEYFANYYLHTCDVSFDLASGAMEVHRSETEPWRVTLIDTGEQTMTGGRLKRVLPVLRARRTSASPTAMAWPTSMSSALIAFHREQGALAHRHRGPAPGALRRAGRRGRARARVRGEAARGRRAGPTAASSCSRPRLRATSTATPRSGSRSRCATLAREGQLASYCHDGFWQAMDTLRDRNHLEELWAPVRLRGAWASA